MAAAMPMGVTQMPTSSPIAPATSSAPSMGTWFSRTPTCDSVSTKAACLLIFPNPVAAATRPSSVAVMTRVTVMMRPLPE